MRKRLLLVLLLLCGAGTASAIEPPSFLPRAVAYQIVFRNFTRAGTIRAATDMLEHVRSAGVDIVYLSPFVRMDEDMNRDGWSPRQIKSGFESPKNPYRIADYAAVDPEYGTEDDLRRFVARAHELGLRVVFDLVYLHCGPNNVIQKSIPEAFERNPDGTVRMTKWKFPYLNFKSPAVREYLWSNMEHFVRDAGCDGFRCDVGDDVPIDFWEEGLRRCRCFRDDFIMINEGDRVEWLERAFHVGYAWSVACCVRETLNGSCRIPFGDLRKAMADYEAKMPRGTLLFNFMDNHDTATDDWERRFDRILPVRAGNAGFVVQFLRRGVPVVFNGNEVADNALSTFFGPVGHPLRAAKSVDWGRALTADGRCRLELIRRLSSLRHTHPALGDGTMTYLTPQGGERVFAFVRASSKGAKLLVAANLSSDPCEFSLPCEPSRVLLEDELTCSDGKFHAGPFGYLVAELRK